jgi:hypothetical protein
MIRLSRRSPCTCACMKLINNGLNGSRSIDLRSSSSAKILERAPGVACMIPYHRRAMSNTSHMIELLQEVLISDDCAKPLDRSNSEDAPGTPGLGAHFVFKPILSFNQIKG